MKSKFFKDTQGLDLPFGLCTPDKVCICLRLDRQAYEYAMGQSQRLGLTSGEYLEWVLLKEAAARHCPPSGGSSAPS